MFKKRKQTKPAQTSSSHGYFTNQQMKDLFTNNQDVHIQTFSFDTNMVTFITCAGMVDEQMIQTVIYERFVRFFDTHAKKSITEETIMTSLYVPGLQRIDSTEKIVTDVFQGNLLVLFHETQLLFSIAASDRPQRQPEETSTEISIKGPRDDFIEDIHTNIALIRKRLRTSSLVIQTYEIGTRTQTQVAVLYIDDIIDMNIVHEIDRRLKEITIDGIYSGNQLKELLSEHSFNIYPTYHYSGRPDFGVHSLLNGRFLILVDGVQYVMIAPVNLSFILKSAEDSENGYLFNSFERMIRLVALTVGTFLPGFWIALISFHQNQIPIAFLGTIVESRRGVPFPGPLEAFIMLFLFELFREAGLRLPPAVGSTLSVVGGLIIGDAAIRAGLTSPMMIIVIAVSAVATNTLVHMSLHGIIGILRFFVVVTSSFFGLFGFFVSIFLIVCHLAHMQTYGIPYLAIPQSQNVKEWFKSILSLPEDEYKTRPSFLQTKDDTKKPTKDKGED